MRALAFALALALSTIAHAANPADPQLLEWHRQVRDGDCDPFARRVKAATAMRDAGVPMVQAHGLDTRADWRLAVLLVYKHKTTPERAAQLCREWGAR